MRRHRRHGRHGGAAGTRWRAPAPAARAGTGGATGDAGPDTPARGPVPTSTPASPVCGSWHRSQLATKTSADGRPQVRLAIERIPDSVGTSGTIPWMAGPLGFVDPGGTVCVKDEAALAGAYKGSHHNCSDVADSGRGGRTFELTTPDTSPGRPDAALTVTTGGSAAAAVDLDSGHLHSATPPAAPARAAGPASSATAAYGGAGPSGCRS